VISVPGIEIRSEVAAAWRERQGVVALESSLISHGLPWPVNLERLAALKKLTDGES